MADHPTWLLNLVEAVADYESKHGHPDDGWTCLAGALERVPEDVCTEARGYGRARREAQSDPGSAEADAHRTSVSLTARSNREVPRG